jgi:hypothetical protein
MMIKLLIFSLAFAFFEKHHVQAQDVLRYLTTKDNLRKKKKKVAIA